MFDPEAFDEDEVGLLFNEVGTNGRVHGHCCRHSQRAAILGPATAAADTLNVLQSWARPLLLLTLSTCCNPIGDAGRGERVPVD